MNEDLFHTEANFLIALLECGPHVAIKWEPHGRNVDDYNQFYKRLRKWFYRNSHYPKINGAAAEWASFYYAYAKYMEKKHDATRA